MQKRFLHRLTVLLITMLWMSSALMAQVNMSNFIVLTVENGENITLTFEADTPNTPIQIVTGNQTYNENAGTTPLSVNYTAYGTTMTIYGDITWLKCSNHGLAVKGLEAHNTVLRSLSCFGNQNLTSLTVEGCTDLETLSCYYNNLGTTAIDELFCSLPDRFDSGIEGWLYILSSPEDEGDYQADAVTYSNSNNAMDKGWYVVYFDGGEENPMIETWGIYQCNSVTGVSLYPITATINAGSSFPLTATITPASANPSLTWSSSDTNVATVSGNGVVQAIAPGTATIAVVTTPNNYTAACTVTVINPVSPFITKWNTNNTSSNIDGQATSSNTQIYFPGIGSNYTIEWEEVNNATHNGTLPNISTTLGNPQLIDFGTPGEYIVKVHPTGFSHIQFEGANSIYGDQEKLTEIQQWGDIGWTQMHRAFSGCKNMQLTANDIPNLTLVSSMNYMFYGCSIFNHDISNWDVSNIKKMAYMFNRCFDFNQDLGNWNLQSVEHSNMHNYNSLDYMFEYSGISCTNYGNTLIGWANNPNTPNNLRLGARNVTFGNNALNARYTLTLDKGWVIYNDIYDENCNSTVWIGRESEDWASANNWKPNTVPSINTPVIIPYSLTNYPNITASANASCKDISLKTGALLLGANHLTVSGTATVNIYIPPYTSDTDGWNLISAPVSNMDITGSDFQPISGIEDFYEYDNPSNTWLNYYDGMGQTGQFIPGKGYLVAYSNYNHRSFEGTLNTAASYPITLNTDKWHLIGNPYPSPIDWSQVTLSNVSSVKRLNNITGAYEDLPANIVDIAEGIFVYAENSAASIDIPVTAQTLGLIPSKSANQMSQLKAKFRDEYHVSIGLGINSEATQNFDWQYDARYLPPVTYIPNLSAVTKDNVQVSTYMFNDENNTVVIPLHFMVYNEEEITFSFEAEIFDNKVMLEDKQTGEMTDITAGDYAFTANPSDNTDRFVLHIQKNAISNEEEPTLSDVNIYAYQQQVYIQVENSITKGKVTLFNTLGQAILSQSIHQGSNRLSVPHKGAYVVSVTSNEGVVSKTVVIQ